MKPLHSPCPTCGGVRRQSPSHGRGVLECDGCPIYSLDDRRSIDCADEALNAIAFGMLVAFLVWLFG